MREITVKIKFTKACLGNVKRYITQGSKKWPCFYMPRTPDGSVRFEANWWKHSIRFAAEVLCRHQRSVSKIHFDVAITGQPEADTDMFYKRYFAAKKFVKHEAFREGEVVGVNCLVPSDISDDDFQQLMDLVGRYKGISPYGPREYGFFVVESLVTRHQPAPKKETNENNDIQGREPDKDPASGCETAEHIGYDAVVQQGCASSDTQGADGARRQESLN